MPDFDQTRKAYAAARRAADDKHSEVILAGERVKRLERRIAALSRRAGADRELAALRRTLAQTREVAAGLKAQHREVLSARRGALAAFAELSDPIKALANLPDDIPIALFPLRLETRFKIIEANGVAQQWLWVRAFPDDALVDAFQPEIAETEYEDVAKYWAARWGGELEMHRAAWAALVRRHGSGRARWLIDRVAPANLDEAPDGAPTLPDKETLPMSQDAWTRGARAWLLPERLVLLGFRDGSEVLREVGNPIPAELQIGPDPSADDQFRADGADLVMPQGMRWTVDFGDAVDKGMAFSINLSARGIAPPFERLFVLGVRVGSDAGEGAAELSQLFEHHQASRKGLSLLPQGRPTNNTDTSSAGYSWWEDPGDTFAHFFETAPDDPDGWERRRDGAWLAGMLGVDRELLRASPYYFGRDQAEARAMNAALWPATLGYYMEQQMEPVFSDRVVSETRALFHRFVIGRGTLPLIRIGRQPYGILPATAWSKMGWWRQPGYARLADTLGLPRHDYLEGLFDVIERAAGTWQSLARGVAHADEPGADRHRTLLEILGLHPTSVEHHQRYSQSFTQHYHMLGFATEPVSEPITAAGRRYMLAGLLALAELGWNSGESGIPDLLEKIFLGRADLLKGALVQTALSDRDPLEVTRADGLNYLAWLRAAAQTSHDTLRKQEGFVDGPPSALLYLWLHHAIDLGFVDAGVGLKRDAFDLAPAAVRAQKKEPKHLHVSDTIDGRSLWESLYLPEPAITGNASQRLGDFIPSVLLTRTPYLQTQLSALEVLSSASSGALERAFVEHVDCLSYRLDAWRMGMHAVQLSYLRREGADGFGRGGVYVGAYGWLEGVAPRGGMLEELTLDGELAETFAKSVLRDPQNRGHIHAPSLDHAVTAAILRNGHLANASAAAPDLLAVDLSSERVRLAQQVIDGIRNGQSLGALLGYRLERALHDEPELFLDRLIYDLRRAFPLAGNRNHKTKTDVPIDKVEARNVVDGAAFAEHVSREGIETYPYGLTLPSLGDFTGPGLPSASEIGALIDGHVAHMRSIADAVADLAVAEGVYQVVRGNYDRAGSSLDAFSKGTHPPEPEVVATPRSGRTLTHRMALHLAGAIAPTGAPRTMGEPSLGAWLEGQLPDSEDVFARVRWHDADGDGELTPSMADLGLGAADLFYLIDEGGAQDMPGFDGMLIDHAEVHGAPRHDATFSLEYKPAGTGGLTLFELAPLVRALRRMLLGARPLRPTDLSLQNEASKSEDAMLVRRDKVQAVRDALDGTVASVVAFITTLDAAIGEGVAPEDARDAARDHIDAWLSEYAGTVRVVVPFGLRAASSTAGVEGRRRPFAALLAMMDALLERWTDKQAEYQAIMDGYDALPPEAGDAERIALLIRAGRAVSTRVIAPIPAIVDLVAEVAGLRGDLDAAVLALQTLRADAREVGATLSALTAVGATVATVDHAPFDLGDIRAMVVALASQLLQSATAMRDDVVQRIADADSAVARAAAATGDAAQTALIDGIQALLGKSFMLLPEFSLGEQRREEWGNAWAHRGDLLAHLPPLALDDWLHGVARVRERPRQLELATLLGAALGADDMALDALQFPHRGDGWVGMELPATTPSGAPYALDEDKLLYTAHFGPGAAIDPGSPARTYAGLLIDEWVEVVPGTHETTGLAFHMERPNSEAPQAILLATPPVLRGGWQFQDLVDTLHETLDFARMRAVEPDQLDQTGLAPLVPAVMSAVTALPIMPMLNLAYNNQLHVTLEAPGE